MDRSVRTNIRKKCMLGGEGLTYARKPTIVECDTKSLMNVSDRYFLEKSIADHLCMTCDDDEVIQKQR